MGEGLREVWPFIKGDTVAIIGIIQLPPPDPGINLGHRASGGGGRLATH